MTTFSIESYKQKPGQWIPQGSIWKSGNDGKFTIEKITLHDHFCNTKEEANEFITKHLLEKGYLPGKKT